MGISERVQLLKRGQRGRPHTVLSLEVLQYIIIHNHLLGFKIYCSNVLNLNGIEIVHAYKHQCSNWGAIMLDIRAIMVSTCGINLVLP